MSWHLREKNFLFKVILILWIGVLAGCGKVGLYSRLDEREANEMVSILSQADLNAEKRSPDGKTWSVYVPQSNFASAIDALRVAGYPKEKFQSLCDIFKREGFISSSLEERARMICGLQQELARTVALIDGVVDARVHISVPERDPLSDKQRPASASVAIKHKPEARLEAIASDIKVLVVNSVEGLPYENVTVKLFAAEPAVLKKTNERFGGFQEQAIYLVLLSITVLLICGILVWRYREWLFDLFPKRKNKNTKLNLRNSSLAEGKTIHE
jgi:type III secretion protein J